jgi:hypothetical protein
MILVAVNLKGQAIRLRDAVNELCIQKGMCISTAAVKMGLAGHCVEKRYMRDDVMVVEDWVIPI